MNERKRLEDNAYFQANINNGVTCVNKYYGGFYGHNKPNYPFEQCLKSKNPKDCKEKVFEGYTKCRGNFTSYRPETMKTLEEEALSSIEYRLKETVDQQKDKFYDEPTSWTLFQRIHRFKCPPAPPEAQQECANVVYNEFKNSISANAIHLTPSQKTVEKYYQWRLQKRQDKINSTKDDEVEERTRKCEKIYYGRHSWWNRDSVGKFEKCTTLAGSDQEQCKNEIGKEFNQCINKKKR